MIIGRERELRYETDIGWIQTYYHKGLSSRIQPDSLQQPRLTYARNIAEMLHISFIPFGLQYNSQEMSKLYTFKQVGKRHTDTFGFIGKRRKELGIELVVT